MKEGAPTAQAQYPPRTNILVARLVVAVAFLDLFMQFPVIAPFARSLGATASMTGIIVAAYSLTNLGGNITAGFLLDRLGRSVPVQAGLLLTALALLGYVFSSSPAHLLAARLVHGLSAAILAPGAFAIIGDAATEGSRMRLMGRSSAPIAAAAVVGPLIAASLGSAAGYPASLPAQRIAHAPCLRDVPHHFSLRLTTVWQGRAKTRRPSRKPTG